MRFFWPVCILFLVSGFFVGRWSITPPELPVPAINENVMTSEISASPPAVSAAAPRSNLPANPETTPPQAVESPPKSDTLDEPPPAEEKVQAATTPRYSLDHWDRRVVEKLEQTKKPRLNAVIQRAQTPSRMTPELQSMMGRFEGDVLLDEGRTWQLTMDNQGSIVQGKLDGRSLVELSRGGRVFSSNSNTGTIQNIRVLGGGQSFLVKISDQYYLEATYDGATDSVFGNFYSRHSNGDYRPRGVAQLTRR